MSTSSYCTHSHTPAEKETHQLRSNPQRSAGMTHSLPTEPQLVVHVTPLECCSDAREGALDLAPAHHHMLSRPGSCVRHQGRVALHSRT
jgi:hypothetical protein